MIKQIMRQQKPDVIARQVVKPKITKHMLV